MKKTSREKSVKIDLSDIVGKGRRLKAMNVGILTLQSSYSYGASLQAYATYLAVQSLGHNATMINYVNAYEQNQNRLISRKGDQSFLKNTIYTIENIALLKKHNMRKAFEGFQGRYKKTARYTRLTDLNREYFDCLISGSDQLWNPDIFGGIDTAFFLDFGDKSSRRISYAASAGSHIFTTDEVRRIKPLLERYNAISVRELALKRQIDSILGSDVPVVLDPTFLLHGKEWLEQTDGVRSLPKNSYILLYMIGVPYEEYKQKYLPVVRFYSEQLKLPVYAINPLSFITLSGADRNLTDYSPLELIKAIDNAALIITSSFHGVAFSINLNKKFVALQTKNPLRIENLLKIAALEERVIDRLDPNRCTELLQEIDYNKTNALLNEKRNESRSWLKTQLDY